MADRLVILSQRLIERLDEQRELPGPQCLSTSRLEAYLAGDLSSDEGEKVKAHLDNCLSCLHAKVQLDDLLRGITEPLPHRNAALLAVQSITRRVLTVVRGALEWTAPAGWGLAGALAGVVLTLLVINVTQEQIQDLAPPAITLRGIPRGSPGGITPPEIQTVTGVVSAVKQGTEEGMPYHLIRMKGDNDNTYQLFSWGKPEIQENDRILVDANVELQSSGTTGKVYSGLAYRVSRLEQTK